MPNFSSGPARSAPDGPSKPSTTRRSAGPHRAKIGKAKLKLAIDLTREVLQVPADYLIGIVPASDTGAYEMAMWTMLGARPVTMVAWESFGEGWVTDAVKQLRLADCTVVNAPYGELPNLKKVNAKTDDICFTWNGTTSGVRVPDADWIPADREGLTFCDATSAAFAQRLDWPKLDVTNFSWQKVLGGEAAHGMLILSPRAVQRLETYKPAWPLPKVFRLTSGGKLIKGIFEGETINTPSMLCVEDYIDALQWAKKVGGLDGLIKRADANTRAITSWVKATPWIDFLAVKPKTRSNTSVCLKFTDPAVTALPADAQANFAKGVVAFLEKEGVGLDLGHYRDAPPGLRIWCGATVQTRDVKALLPWIEAAFAAEKAKLTRAA